jgi:hypothetical protein
MVNLHIVLQETYV